MAYSQHPKHRQNTSGILWDVGTVFKGEFDADEAAGFE